jgi:hypothetical protein
VLKVLGSLPSTAKHNKIKAIRLTKAAKVGLQKEFFSGLVNFYIRHSSIEIT